MQKSSFLLFLVCLFSCQSTNFNPTEFNIRSAIESSIDRRIDELCDTVWYVRLETVNDALLVNPGFCFTDTSIVALDESRIFQFDQSGKYLRKIDRRGQGPEDLGWVNRLIWNKDRKELYAWDGMLRKLLVYDENLNFLRYIPFKGGGMKSAIVRGDCLFIGEVRDDFRKKGIHYSVRKVNLLTGESVNWVQSRVPAITPDSPPTSFFGTLLYDCGEDIFLKEYRADSVFKLEPDSGISFAYHMNVGEIMPAELDYGSNSLQQEEQKKYIHIGMVTDLEDYLLVSYRFGGTNGNVLCSKVTGETVRVSHAKTNQLDGGIPIIMSLALDQYKRTFFSGTLSAEKLLNVDFIHSVERASEVNPELKQKLLHLITEISEDDNPVLMFVRKK